LIEQVKWDSAFFGRKIGRLTAVPPDVETLKKELDWAVRQKFAYLTCRLWAVDIGAVQRLEKHGFYLTDVGIVWEKSSARSPLPQIPVTEGTINDVASVRKIAKDLFTDGRFYHDPFFSRQEADSLYQSWVENSLKGYADKVFLVQDKGFIACRKSDAGGEIQLIGVAREFRGEGIGTALVQAAVFWFCSIGAGRVFVRTQASNISAVNLYEKNHFHLKTADITMAKVFSPREKW
jgi:dTDP-4-amino-4,6-dideoxy-D-galactose acyltransferase